MKKQFSLFLLSTGIILGSVSMTGCNSQEVNAQELAKEVEVNQEVNQLDVFGKVEAAAIRELAVDFPATIETIDLKAGDLVEKGTQLMTLDYESYKNEIIKKEQEIQLLKVEREAAYSSLDPQSVTINQKNSELKTKQKQLSNGTDPELIKIEEQIKILDQQISIAEKDYEVSKSLIEVGGISDKELKDKEMSLAELKNNKYQAENTLKQLTTSKQLEVDSLKGSIDSLQLTVSNTSTEKASKVEALDIKIQTAETELKEMKAKLTKAYLKDKAIVLDQKEGVVYEILVTEGTRLKGGEPIMRLIDPSKLTALVDVPEAFINKIKVGEKADLYLAASPDDAISAKVSRIAQAAKVVNGENMISVELEVTENQAVLKQGYEVNAIIYY